MAGRKAKQELDKIRGVKDRDPQYDRLLARAVAAIDQCTDEDSSPLWDALDKLNVYVAMRMG